MYPAHFLEHCLGSAVRTNESEIKWFPEVNRRPDCEDHVAATTCVNIGNVQI
jgi:hypothetical protein